MPTPDLTASRVNRALAGAVADLPDVTVRNLAAVRGEDGFGVTEEQRLLVEHDAVVPSFRGTGIPCPG